MLMLLVPKMVRAFGNQDLKSLVTKLCETFVKRKALDLNFLKHLLKLHDIGSDIREWIDGPSTFQVSKRIPSGLREPVLLMWTYKL